MGTSRLPARRREFLVIPGEGVALSPDLDTYLDRCATFLDATGLTVADVVSSPLVQIPIPQGVRDSSGYPLRWDGVRPEILWHPFFWLPGSVALRAHVIDDSGVARVETDEEYLIRVIVQCVASGLLDVDTGTWLDVPSQFGIDIDDPAVRERLLRWEQGSEDALFELIDITPMFRNCSVSSEIVFNAIRQTPMYVLAQWAYTASQIGRTISDLQEDDREFGSGRSEQQVQTYRALVNAYAGFGGGELIGDSDVRDQVQNMLAALEQPDADIDKIRAQLLQLTAEIYVMAKPSLDEVNFAAQEVRQAA